MKKYLFVLVLILYALAFLKAQESVTLTTPITSTVTAKHVGYISLDLDNSRIIIQIENASNAIIVSKVYDNTTNPTGSTLLHALNTGNFSVNSLMKAVYARLQTDGVIEAGTISGVAQ